MAANVAPPREALCIYWVTKIYRHQGEFVGAVLFADVPLVACQRETNARGSHSYFVAAYLTGWLIDLIITVACGPILIDPILKLSPA